MDSSFGITYGMYDRGSSLGREKEIYLYTTAFRLKLEPT
jgi:hypothetical protein